MKPHLLPFLAILAAGCYDRAQFVENQVQPGQVWVQESADPFNQEKHTNTVLEVRGDWVKFRTQDGFTHTAMEWTFIHRAKRMR